MLVVVKKNKEFFARRGCMEALTYQSILEIVLSYITRPQSILSTWLSLVLSSLLLIIIFLSKY